jgi:hypothetical protein
MPTRKESPRRRENDGGHQGLSGCLDFSSSGRLRSDMEKRQLGRTLSIATMIVGSVTVLHCSRDSSGGRAGDGSVNGAGGDVGASTVSDQAGASTAVTSGGDSGTAGAPATDVAAAGEAVVAEAGRGASGMNAGTGPGGGGARAPGGGGTGGDNAGGDGGSTGIGGISTGGTSTGGEAGVVSQAGTSQAGGTATGTDTAPGGNGGGGSGTVESDGPYLELLGSGILHCGVVTFSSNRTIIGKVDWAVIHVTNVGQSGIADITVTVTDGTNSYVEQKQFSMLAGADYDLSVGVPLVPRTSASEPDPWPRTKAVLSLPGAPSEITLIDDWPTLNSAVPPAWYWTAPTGPSTTTLDPPPCQ